MGVGLSIGTPYPFENPVSATEYNPFGAMVKKSHY